MLTFPAIRFRQNGHTLLSFVADGKAIASFATVSRLRREDGEIAGYQRPEVQSHIANIRRYLESEGAMVPNAIVIAFDLRAVFSPAAGQDLGGTAVLGTLTLPATSEEDRPGWIVDGQQRCAAFREAEITGFPMPVTAFLAPDPATQVEQFVLVNSAKPLSKALIYELLPGVEGTLVRALEAKRLPAVLLARLNADEDSPLKGLIETATNPKAGASQGTGISAKGAQKRAAEGGYRGVIKDTSILKAIQDSLADGALRFLARAEESPDALERGLRILKAYWSAVKAAFPGAWGLPARFSRLHHGGGVNAMSFVLDTLADHLVAEGVANPTADDFAPFLAALAPHCAWTSGAWDFGGGNLRPFNQLQNTGQDLRLLSDHLCRLVRKQLVASARAAS